MLSKLNKQEQVQVIIRLRPLSEETANHKCAYVSPEHDQTLVVETLNKKQFFVFDNIANEDSSQSHLYHEIGKQILKSSTEGFNCCLFAYGQTGAGKTYSILGKPHDLASNMHCESRGILPRLLNDLYMWQKKWESRSQIKCSYMEIYNQQIFDLLNYEERNHQIREDLKRGVFVEGLCEETIDSYEKSISILMKGIKNRKISQTEMNDESSRSHTIFTITIQSQIVQDEIIKCRKSKIHIVDLAGSQRAKQTKVQGQRLKQGCNINKSLHVLGNVINALVESSKKKKHIPFRDSKLTLFLKDSLCGNSITKLLANIHPSKNFLGETLSTLMFAKRAKILKLKVEVNENVTQNFQELRKEIKRLRQELAQAKYLKNESRMMEKTPSDSFYQGSERIIDPEEFDLVKNENVLEIFEENEMNYKALMDIYEEHMKICQHSQMRKSTNIHKEWKRLEKKNEVYLNLMKNMPAFTKIFKENVILRRQIKKGQIPFRKNDKKEQQKRGIKKQTVSQVVAHYEEMLKNVEEKLSEYVKKLQDAYQQLQDENKMKDEKIKQLMKRKEVPPDLQELKNQNEYLKLNVMELQDEIEEQEHKITRYQIQVKELKKQTKFHSQVSQQDCSSYVGKLTDLKIQLQQDEKQYEEEKKDMEEYIERLRKELVKYADENNRMRQNIECLVLQNKEFRRKNHELLNISEIQTVKISDISFDESINLQKTQITKLKLRIDHLTIQNQQLKSHIKMPQKGHLPHSKSSNRLGKWVQVKERRERDENRKRSDIGNLKKNSILRIKEFK